ncbi:hypothetical protein [Gluconacetobacter tumulicola]|uniref:Uncharacterized protein n=1 Tax=Gluconacetobacter tumulicola TaxID=1017177 RepID=A0A7W4JEF2_9PROT|nr:hypothetical protein [Gluconacetobacter tumulicola]MBB2179709.1 hypothetical protein [Gluconacetobacter tumulicola]
MDQNDAGHRGGQHNGDHGANPQSPADPQAAKRLAFSKSNWRNQRSPFSYNISVILMNINRLMEFKNKYGQLRSDIT